MEFIAKTFYGLSVDELYEIMKSRNEIFLLEQNIICQEIHAHRCSIGGNFQVGVSLFDFV